ncbi:KAT8 regulatory NSL complex subunit 3 isoform X2 [Dendroctonus ponderosae]|uniref:KAT8 regulatory NSL complex subunit 3 isoform X2 n=1 Tax=Dendroctonus ponderosae TaxID=77166 RepID=UPI0020359CA6|nr:KAT8 regulatory NSL complex subunit 3 isoform X2 [Dendroctonus ponderosae]
MLPVSSYSETSAQNYPLELTSKKSAFIQQYQEQHSTETMVIENEPAKYTYPIQITNPFERETWAISTDHCYARPWNWRPESSFLKPTKTLFVPKDNTTRPLFGITSVKNVDDCIDVEAVPELPTPIYDMQRATNLMDECEKHSILCRNSSDDYIWEEKIDKSNWTNSQNRLFTGFVSVLNNFYVGKMTYSGMKNEPVLRRTIIDKAVQRVRRLFNTVSYDTKLLQWIHQLLLDNLDQQNLSSYFDILQTLKSKVPKFVEKLLNTPISGSRTGPLSNENLLQLMKKPWDPIEISLAQDKPKRLPSSPVLVLMPCSPSVSKRNFKWMALLSNLGQVVSVPTNFGSGSHRLTMTNLIDQMFSLARGKVQEVRENYAGRHIILVGVGAGATLAIQVAQVENVFCVISLGFSMLTAEGRRGDPDDGLLELQCPALFVIGQFSSTSFQEDMEGLRERMRFETGLIVVGSADNNLIINKKKKREEGITQGIVDRCIIDEIGEFISSLILSPYPPQVRQSSNNIPSDAQKKGKSERKRFNSNTSSVESEPPSPTPRITRPVGRPAGKTKCKLEAKWAAQVAQGTTPTTNSNNTSSLSSGVNSSPLTSTEAASAVDRPVSPSHNFNTSSQKIDDLQTGITRKMRVLKPITSGETQGKTSQKITRGEHGGSEQGRNLIPGGQLSTLLQGGIKTIPPAVQPKHGSTSSTIKVLENVQLSSQASAKLISNSNSRTIDLSKIGLGQRTSGSIMILPDGKLKTVATSRAVPMKTSTGSPIIVSMSGKAQPKTTQFVTTKKHDSPKPTVKRHTLVPFTQPMKASLPPPTNLTTQDIMDLPIIFADDNQVIDPNVPTDLSTTSTTTQPNQINDHLFQATKFISPTPTNKFVIVNKPASGLNNLIVSPSTLKRPNQVPLAKQPTKYTKIILSKKSVEPIIGRVPNSSPQSILNTCGEEAIDLENELMATAVPKPGLSMEKRPLNIITKKGNFDLNEQIFMDDDDPDYVPPKNLKL